MDVMISCNAICTNKCHYSCVKCLTCWKITDCTELTMGELMETTSHWLQHLAIMLWLEQASATRNSVHPFNSHVL